jgi:hypothetical protein
MTSSDTYSDLGGGIPTTAETYRCAILCDGTGWTRAVDPDDRVPVLCPEHRPVATDAVRKTRRKRAYAYR